MVNKKVYGLLGIATKAGKVISGTDIVIENLAKIKLVLVAEDSSEKTKKNIQFFCQKANVTMLVFGKIEDNSKAIGKQNRAVIAIKDMHFAEEIKKLILGGEGFGKNENS